MSTLATKFEKFHADNPQIYEALVMFAREWKNETHAKKSSIARVVERARWDFAIRTRNADGYKISNSFRAFYARLIMAQESDLIGFFDIHQSVADEWIRSRPAA